MSEDLRNVIEVDWRGDPRAGQEAIADAITDFTHTERTTP